MRFRHALLALGLVLGLPHAGATVLYKSVDSRGVVTFSDMPPPPNARLVEQREITIASPGTPYSGSLATPVERIFDFDAALSQANARVDNAERALAEARRALGSPLEAMRMRQTRLDREAEQRVEQEKRNVLVARRALLDLMRERQRPVMAAAPEPGAPIIIGYVRR